MPGEPDLSQFLTFGWPIVQALLLHFLSREAFRDSEATEHRKQEAIGALLTDHADAVFGYLDNELLNEQFAFRDLSIEDRARVDLARRKEAERIASAVWEDALEARNLEYWWLGWRGWERAGRLACDAGRLLAGIAVVLLLLLYLRGEFPNLSQGLALVLAIAGLGLPLAVALVSIAPKSIMQNRAMRILDAPHRGTVRGVRRFGSA